MMNTAPDVEVGWATLTSDVITTDVPEMITVVAVTELLEAGGSACTGGKVELVKAMIGGAVVVVVVVGGGCTTWGEESEELSRAGGEQFLTCVNISQAEHSMTYFLLEAHRQFQLRAPGSILAGDHEVKPLPCKQSAHLRHS